MRLKHSCRDSGSSSKWTVPGSALLLQRNECHFLYRRSALRQAAERPSGSIVREEFFGDKTPVSKAVFKDPLTAAASIYVNKPGKAASEAIVMEAAIVGIAFVELRPPPKKPMPEVIPHVVPSQSPQNR